ncbi:hypothetical protein F2Q65_11620 [Thiohalocapsa marina]|uniref:Methyl-accepting transducer domain-containing protein n=1 Tax=Thiohalocapsa marina TaxID=424902 RepID=A0A5M8FLM7_9GAMM|nr:methyl-accepting chemotaxis protein [Thiohalocapsa marina]KAA6184616.1 hypothetical protein F2Q65_11620 [Thiohalocapsa marina]
MAKKLKLSRRIVLGYMVPCIVFTIAVVAIYLEALNLERTQAEIGRASAIVDHGLKLQLDALELQRAARGMLLAPDAALQAAYEQSRQRADAELGVLQTLVKDAAQGETLQQIGELTRTIAETTRRQMELVQAGQVQEARDLFQRGRSEEIFQSLKDLHQQFNQREQEILATLEARGAAQLEHLILSAWYGLGIALMISIGAALVIARRVTADLSQLVAVVASSSAEIAATTEQHEGAMTQQASAVTETTATVEEMVSSARINAEHAESATESAGQVQGTTNEGLALVTQNEHDMGVMEETMTRIAQQIIGLSEQAGQIGEIARVVGELAAETNMLALNAAVEAARAGEQGRGFAVVASEIRKLADQSKKSVERANQIVSDIQNATNGIVMAVEEGSKTTHATAESARQASDAFEKVSQLADAVHQNAQQVLLNSKQQAVALAQIDIAMKNISNGAREMSAGTLQVREGMARLSGVADELRGLL